VEIHELEISEIIQETADARSFVLDVPAALEERFRYRAGQFLTFHVPWGETTLIRCYSLSSAPATDPRPKVTVKRIEDGRVSRWFNERLAPGDRLRVTPPAGRFVLDEGSAPAVLFGAGSGITPVISLIKSILATTSRRARLLYANRDADSVIFRDELARLKQEHSERLEIVHHLDSESGFVDPQAVGKQLAGVEEGRFFVCGPSAFMDVVESALAGAGTPPERISIERFSSPPDGQAPASEVGDAAEVPAELIIHLEGRTHRVPYRPGQSILEAAQAAGVHPPFACEEGYCGSCAARRVEGRVQMANNDVFTDREVEEGHILTCQGRAEGPVCEIRYED